MESPEPLTGGIWRWYDMLVLAMYRFTLGLLMFLALAIGLSVLMRRVFDNPIGWVVQGGQYTLAYMAFFAAPRLLQMNGHTRMTLMMERLGPLGGTRLKLFANLVAVLICIVLVWQTGDSTIGSIRDNSIYRGNFDISRALIWWVMPFGFTLLLIEFSRESWRDLLRLRSFGRRGDPPADGQDQQSRPGYL